MSKYKITFADGDSPIEVDGWINIESTLRYKLGSPVVIGHPGDLSDGGERTLFWASEDEAADDDGAHALGAVVRADQPTG